MTRHEIVELNAKVNAEIKYVDDVVSCGHKDFWSLPEETARRGHGDCEDIAILKMDSLAKAGVPEDSMRLDYVIDMTRRKAHIVLEYRDDDDIWVLDCLTDEVMTLKERTDLVYYFGMNKKGLWIGDKYAGGPERYKEWGDFITRQDKEEKDDTGK